MDVTTALLADAAVVQGGKLYVHGGGWDRIYAQRYPATHPSMAVALVFRVEYDEALSDLPISMSLHTEDGNPIGPVVTNTINVGHSPGTQRGAPSFIPMTLTLNGVTFDGPGRYYISVARGEDEMTRIPFAVQPPPTSPQVSGAEGE